MNYLKVTYLNKEVQIYPGDTYYKYGIVRDISDAGVVFEITRTNASDFDVGSLRFIAFSSNLTFSLPKQI